MLCKNFHSITFYCLLSPAKIKHEIGNNKLNLINCIVLYNNMYDPSMYAFALPTICRNILIVKKEDERNPVFSEPLN